MEKEIKFSDDVDKTEDFIHRTGTFKNRNEILHVDHWVPTTENLQGIIFICHGLGEYIGESYDRVAKFHTKNAFYVFGNDHIGHGRSNPGGPRVSVSDFDDYTENCLFHCRLVREAYPNVPMFILGHSMGGLIALHCILKESRLFDGAILVGPLIKVDPSLATPLKVFAVKTLNFLWPSFPVGVLELNDLTSDENWIRKMEEDRLRFHGELKAKHSYMLLQAMKEIHGRIGELNLPLLVQHGRRDKVCELSGSEMIKELFRGDTSVILKTYDAKHGLFVEQSHIVEEVLKDEKDWFQELMGNK